VAKLLLALALIICSIIMLAAVHIYRKKQIKEVISICDGCDFIDGDSIYRCCTCDNGSNYRNISIKKDESEE